MLWISKLGYTLVFIMTLFGTCQISLAMTNNCTNYYSANFAKQAEYQEPSLNDLRKHLMGVHVTDYLPTGGILKAAYNKGLSMRPTVHFALGQMVVSHALGQWEKKKYAILTPFNQMEKQLINVFHQDTFILGDLKLKKGSIFIVPEGESIDSSIGELEIIRFNPEKISLRNKITEVLQERNQWVFEATGGNNYDKVFFKGIQLDQKKFFYSIMTKYPYVTFGLHYSHPTGKIDHFMSDNLGIFKEASLATERHYLDWILKLEQIKLYLEQSDQIARKFRNIPEVNNIYVSAKKRFENRTNIILAEIEIQKKHGKTLLGSRNLPREFLDQVRIIATDKDKLVDFLEQNLEQFNVVDVDLKDARNDVYTSYDLMELRTELSVKDFSEFLKSQPEIMESAGGLEFQLALKTIETTKSLERKKKVFSESLSKCIYKQCHSLLFRLLNSEVGFDKNTLMTDPRVANHLSQFYDMKAFTHLRPKDEDARSWIWFARELFRTRNKVKWWNEGLRLYGFEEVR